jgi:phage shock protein PspC (stress-responsive transcriptional regulator)
MRPVIAASLNGRAYQLEDDAHAALAQYLAAAERALEGNPDRAEILADLEQAIADKCERLLGPHKTVLTEAEIERVIGEMGPVEGGAGPQGARAGAAPAHEPPPGPGSAAGAAPKRLYQISEGALLSGVCKGIAVYFDVDVTVVRLSFVLAAVLTGGAAILAYIVMMFVVPYAQTPEEVAAAGGLPFNARVLVEQWKRKAAQFADAAAHAARTDGSPDERARWRAEWRQARWQWRQEWRRSRAEWRARRWGPYRRGAWDASPLPPAPPLPPLAAFLSGLGWAVLGILVALVTLAWLFALLSLLATGAVFGWSLGHLPLWAAVIVLIVLYQLVVSPLRALRYAHSPYCYAHRYRAHALADAIMGLALLALLLWVLGLHVPALQHRIDWLHAQIAPLWRGGARAASNPTH